MVLYLETPPDAQTIRQLLKMLNMGSARDLMRQKEDLYKSLNLNDTSLTEDRLIQAMVDNPKLIERPIVVANGKARIGRPPEDVLGSSNRYAAALSETPAAYALPAFLRFSPVVKLTQLDQQRSRRFTVHPRNDFA